MEEVAKQKINASENTTAQKTPTPNNSLNLTRTEVLAAIDGEIGRLENESKRAGWSIWGLQAAVATLIWLGLGQISKQTDWQLVGSLFLLLSFAFDLLLGLSTWVNKSKIVPLIPNKRFQSLGSGPDLSTAILIFTICRVSVLLIVYSVLAPNYRVPLIPFYCVTILVIYGTALLSRHSSRFVKVVSVSTLTENVATSIMLVLYVYFFVVLLGKIPFSLEKPDAADYRLSAIAAGIVYLGWLLVKGERYMPLINTLKDLRRDTAFGRVDVKDSLAKVDEALSGLTGDTVLRRRISDLAQLADLAINSNSRFNSACGMSDKIFDEINTCREQAQLIALKRKLALVLDDCEEKMKDSNQTFSKLFHNTKSSLAFWDTLKNSGHGISTETIIAWQQTWEKVRSEHDKMVLCNSRHEANKKRFLTLPEENYEPDGPQDPKSGGADTSSGINSDRGLTA